jgi:hypothetical protein
LLSGNYNIMSVQWRRKPWQYPASQMAPPSALACIKTKESRLLHSVLIRGHCIRFMLVGRNSLMNNIIIQVGLMACLNFKYWGKHRNFGSQFSWWSNFILKGFLEHLFLLLLFFLSCVRYL